MVDDSEMMGESHGMQQHPEDMMGESQGIPEEEEEEGEMQINLS